MSIRTLAFAAGLLVATVAAFAAAGPPDQFIREATGELRQMIRENRALYESNPQKYFSDVEATVVPHFDTRYIGQIILGTHWRSASESQRERFIVAFKNNLVHSYARALLEHADTVELEWKPVRMAQGADEATVNVDLVRKERPPIPIGFAVHRVDSRWKVYDVTIENISLALTFRSQFNPELKKNGIEGLIKRLEAREKPLEELPGA